MSNDAWIDLHSLANYGSGFLHNKVFFFFHYEQDEKHDPALIYHLRVALRSVGHKITKIEYTLVGEEKRLYQVEIETTITTDEWRKAHQLYGEWATATKSHRCIPHLADEERESEDESEDSTDPI